MSSDTSLVTTKFITARDGSQVKIVVPFDEPDFQLHIHPWLNREGTTITSYERGRPRMNFDGTPQRFDFDR